MPSSGTTMIARAKGRISYGLQESKTERLVKICGENENLQPDRSAERKVEKGSALRRQ